MQGSTYEKSLPAMWHTERPVFEPPDHGRGVLCAEPQAFSHPSAWPRLRLVPSRPLHVSRHQPTHYQHAKVLVWNVISADATRPEVLLGVVFPAQAAITLHPHQRIRGLPSQYLFVSGVLQNCPSQGIPLMCKQILCLSNLSESMWRYASALKFIEKHLEDHMESVTYERSTNEVVES